MKRIIVILGLGLILCSCKAKKTVVAKKPRTTTHQVIKPRVETFPKEEDIRVRKVYASNTEKYIDTYKDIAQNEMQLYHIPASITLAQGILESASGIGRLSVEANNHFGIKCHEWTGAKIYHVSGNTLMLNIHSEIIPCF